MRNFPIVSLSSQDTLSESSVLPTRGIKKWRKDLGEILFFYPLLLTNLIALQSFLCFLLLPPTLLFLLLKASFSHGILFLSVVT